MRGAIMQLNDNEIEYLKILFEKFEDDIRNDIIHCETGAESLAMKILNNTAWIDIVSEMNTAKKQDLKL